MSRKGFKDVEVARLLLLLNAGSRGISRDAEGSERSSVFGKSIAHGVELLEPPTAPLAQTQTVYDVSPRERADTSCLEEKRTASDRERFRALAIRMTHGRGDIELEEHEIVGGPIREYPEVCGVLVDVTSPKGEVVITSQGHPVQQVATGEKGVENGYVEMTIRKDQICRTYGGSTVLYYKPSEAYIVTEAARLTIAFQEPQPQTTRIKRPLRVLPNFHDFITGVPSVFPLAKPNLTVRLQKDSRGRFGLSQDSSCLRTETKGFNFFRWFTGQTGRGNVCGPMVLRISLPDAMPIPKKVTIMRDISSDYHYARRMIFKTYKDAILLNKNIREFVVYVTEPSWK